MLTTSEAPCQAPRYHSELILDIVPALIGVYRVMVEIEEIINKVQTKKVLLQKKHGAQIQTETRSVGVEEKETHG